MARARRHTRTIPAPLEPLEPRRLLSTVFNNPGPLTPQNPGVFNLASANGQLLFANDDASRGHEPWRSDGTLQGTSLLKDINPGQPASLTTSSTFLTVNTTTFFAAKDLDHGV